MLDRVVFCHRRGQRGEKEAAAEALFQEGQSLLNQGRFADACPTLLKSYELIPNGGTLLSLASCYESNGQYASAWAAYKKLESRAADARKADMEKLAVQRAAALEPKMPRLKVRITAGAELPDLELRQDGELIDRVTWGAAIPVDPGTRTFTASAAGRKPWTQKLELAEGTKTYELVVPVLEIDPTAAKPEAPSTSATSPIAASTSDGSTLRVVGLVVAGVGVAALGTGVFFYTQAKSKEDEVTALRESRGPWDPSAYDSGTRDAKLSGILFATGGAVMATGAVLFVYGLATRGESAASTSTSASAMRIDVMPGSQASSVRASWRF